MAALALILSIIALIFAYLAYTRSGGSTDELKEKVEDLGITTEKLRKKTADALGRLERTVRGEEKPAAEPEETVEGEVVEEEPKEEAPAEEEPKKEAE